jgi:hypothetical protein
MEETTQNPSVSFDRVVALNEAAKELLERSLKVNLLALNAMVQSKRSGGACRGFDEVSAQMRSWSQQLHGQLRSLGQLSQTTVRDLSLYEKQRRLSRLLERAIESVATVSSSAVLQRSRAELEANLLGLESGRRRLSLLIDDLVQLGMMASVLSRSAMIEAQSGPAEIRQQLSDVSREFYDNAEAVVETLRALLKSIRSE